MNGRNFRKAEVNGRGPCWQWHPDPSRGDAGRRGSDGQIPHPGRGHAAQTSRSSGSTRRRRRWRTGRTLPTKAEDPPSLAMAQATLAGAPPGALTKPPDSASDSPATSGTKSISISPNDTTRLLDAAAAAAPPSPRGAIWSRLLAAARWTRLRERERERERRGLVGKGRRGDCAAAAVVVEGGAVLRFYNPESPNVTGLDGTRIYRPSLSARKIDKFLVRICFILFYFLSLSLPCGPAWLVSALWTRLVGQGVRWRGVQRSVGEDFGRQSPLSCN